MTLTPIFKNTLEAHGIAPCGAEDARQVGDVAEPVPAAESGVGFTPGPWEGDRTAVRSEGPRGRQVCLCEISVRGRPYDETYDEALANARLIAAAPELYEALAGMVRQWEPAYPIENDEQAAYDAARAALSKARGE